MVLGLIQIHTLKNILETLKKNPRNQFFLNLSKLEWEITKNVMFQKYFRIFVLHCFYALN